MAIVLVTIIVARGVRLPSLRRPSIVAAVLLVIELALGVVISLMGLAPTQTNGIDATIAVGYSAVAVTLMWALAWILGGASRAADAGADADEPLAVLSID